jgi:two-component system, chemotaxis family, sensor kinase CheA
VLLTDATDAAIAEAAGARAEDVRVVMTAIASSAPAAAFAPIGPSRDDFDDDAATTRAGVLRVEVSRVDDAIEKLSALIVTRWRMQHALDALAATGAPVRDLQAILVENARQLRDMRAAILRVRMVPIASMLERLPLVVRGLAKATKKQVRLVTEGGGAELDKTVAERLFPALVHLLRNAVDHGIETPEERERAGKDPQAVLRITAATRNRQVEIRIEDDGRGVDRAEVARRAGAPIPTDDPTLLELMCRSGLSTRKEADTTSGRGLGLDIVRKIVVDGLAGELLLQTRAGEGTCFVLRVPLTIAIVDAFVAACAGARYVVPVPVVEEIVSLEGDNRELIVRRGEPVPVVDLAAALGAKSDGVRRAHALVVRRTHDDPVAFAIDRVLGQQEAVVRPLADPLVAVPGVSGSTDLGDGRATLVLDLHGLVARLGNEPPRLPEQAS